MSKSSDEERPRASLRTTAIASIITIMFALPSNSLIEVSMNRRSAFGRVSRCLKLPHWEVSISLIIGLKLHSFGQFDELMLSAINGNPSELELKLADVATISESSRTILEPTRRLLNDSAES